MRTLVIHPDLGTGTRIPELALAEAISLTDALSELEVAGSDVVKVRKVNAGTLFGKGKVSEIGLRCKAEEIDLVVVDGSITPIQQRNLEEEWNVKVLDRTGLILEIFGERAQTREGVLQVDLAHLSYQKSRLVRAWTHLERQRGGMGFVGGPGETQIESDRRAIDDQIQRIRKQLSKVVKTRKLHREARQKVPYPIVALVGYTNAGKSSLFNRLTGASVMAKDMLFATLDPTMRKIELPSGREIIMSDTVGFISELPTQLIAAFRATLEEVLDADLVIHVRDISHPETEGQAKDVRAILEELGIGETDQDKMIEVFNKTDLLESERAEAVERIVERNDLAVATSATTGEGMDKLCDLIELSLQVPMISEIVDLSFSQGKDRSWLFQQEVVASEEQDENGFHLSVNWTQKQRNMFQQMRSGY